MQETLYHTTAPKITETAPNTADTADTPSFSALGLGKNIIAALTQAGYETPTPIQAGAIPPSLEKKDLLLSAQTGSGKTAAFVLPILHHIDKARLDPKKVRAVILTPTRELALQVQDNVRKYSSRLKGLFSVPLVGGAAYGGQIRALRKGVQIIVATPGRFIDHLNEGRIDLSELEVLVLDEADRMLDMGFSEDINAILAATPEHRQTIMSSATWDGEVGKIAESFTKNPERVSIKVESAHIDESVYFCDDFKHKNEILYSVLNNPEIGQAVIFAATKMSTERLAEDLNEKGYKARYLHGDLPQGKRNRIVSDIKAGKAKFLIATDVAARGIDIASISHVINYDLPRQAEDYVHRIGRCGRAGRTGQAINLCSIDDKGLFFGINRYLGRKMKSATIEGLEPKRNFGEERRFEKDKKGRKGKSGFGRGGRFTKDADEMSYGRKARRHEVGDGFEAYPHRQKQPRFQKAHEGADFGGQFEQGGRFERHEKSDGHYDKKPSFHKTKHKSAEFSAQRQGEKAGGRFFDKSGEKTQDKFEKRADRFKKESGMPNAKHPKAKHGDKKDTSYMKKDADRHPKAFNARQKDKKGVVEMVFNQTAPKRRFGTA